jgi:hypothetical protein
VDYGDMPQSMKHLPVDYAGRPVPWFVAWFDGKPDFRVTKAGAVRDALKYGFCWVCGEIMWHSHDRAFVIGPMCAVNRVSAEPPGHRACAVYSAVHCPFLVKPQMRRREKHMPQDTMQPPGNMIRRNPGVALVWVTAAKAWSTFKDSDGGTLFDIGEPKQALWFAEGRTATRAEVLASIDSGLPILREMAELDGPAAVTQLGEMHQRALELVPA